MTSIGTVIATSDSPSLEKIELILNKNDHLLIERGQFVCIPKTEAIFVLGIITGIKKYNAYYETLDSGIQEIASRNYEAIFPIEEWERTLVELKPLGEINIEKDRINRLNFPVSPGSKAYIAKSSFISKFLGLDENGIYWGDIYSNDLKIKINLSRLLRKHLAILAISGAGKSYATYVLLEELYKLGEISVVVIDPHGEYAKIIPIIDNNSRIEVIKGSFISIGVPKLSAWEISEFIPDISIVQTRVLENVITQTKEKYNNIYGLLEIIKLIEYSDNINTRTKEALVGWLHSLYRTFLFSAQEDPEINQFIKPGKIVIVDLSEMPNLRNRQIVTLHFLKTIYYQRTQGKVPPILFIIEEAHNFCPETRRAISKRIIETIAREGRKFYTSLCLISQRPVNMSVTALSQCNTNLILRIRNPYDLDFIGRMSEGIDRSALKMLPDLGIGEALLVGEGINYPTFFHIRSLNFNLNELSPSFEEMIKKYTKS